MKRAKTTRAVRPKEREAYIAALERMADTKWDTANLIEWIRDVRRKPANLAFTAGPARQVAYAVEDALEIARNEGRG